MISVIIPNWNGAAHLPECLAALNAQTERDFEVLIVDNNSTDESLRLLAARHTTVRVIALPHNAGFTGACNAGMAAAYGSFLALLNNDTAAAPDWLAEVRAAFARHPHAGSVASRMLLFDKRDTLHTAGDLFGSDGMPANRGVWQADTGQYLEGEVFSACGGSAVYRRSMLEETGLLDERFFFSCEDVDLGWRAQLRGWCCVYAPRAVVYHKLASTGGGPTASYFDGRNSIHVLVKDVPGIVWRLYWRSILMCQLQLAVQALRSWRGAAARARLRGQLAGLGAVPAMLAARRRVQAARLISDEQVLALLSSPAHNT